MADLTETVKMDVYRQMVLCRETYKPIFAAFTNGQAPKIDLYVSEVMAYYEMLVDYVTSERLGSEKYDYLESLHLVEPYVNDPTAVYTEVYIQNGKKLDSRDRKQEKIIGARRAVILKKFEQVRQALDRFAFDLGIVTATGRHEGKT
jgi:hypothetical protein